MAEEETFFSKNGFLKLGRLFLIVYIIELAVFFIISSIPYSNPGLAASLKTTQNSITGMGLLPMILYISSHNLFIATVEFIPFLGQAMFVFSIIETPLVLSASATSAGVPGILAFISILLIPDTLIEISSYAVATATSIYMIYIMIHSRGKLMGKMRKIFYLYLFTALELFIAGTFESVAITFAQTQASPNNVIYSLLLWIPAVPIIYLLIRLFRRINRDEYVKSTDDILESFGLS